MAKNKMAVARLRAQNDKVIIIKLLSWIDLHWDFMVHNEILRCSAGRTLLTLYKVITLGGPLSRPGT
jgi:hypothetical protein